MRKATPGRTESSATGRRGESSGERDAAERGKPKSDSAADGLAPAQGLARSPPRPVPQGLRPSGAASHSSSSPSGAPSRPW
jgi:hypothetical protein